MTKQEFLNEIKKNLSGLPTNDIDDRLDFYAEMIAFRFGKVAGRVVSVNVNEKLNVTRLTCVGAQIQERVGKCLA